MKCQDSSGAWQRWSVALGASAFVILVTAACSSAPRKEGSSIEVARDTEGHRAQGRSVAAAGPDIEFTRMLFPAVKTTESATGDDSVHDVILPWHLKLWAMHHMGEILKMLETSPKIDEAAFDALDPITRLYFLQRMAIPEDLTIEDYEVGGGSR